MFQNSLISCQNLFFHGILKNWQEHAFDPLRGFSYESMRHNWERNKVGRVRLLTQCRQLYTLSHASLSYSDCVNNSLLTPLFDFILAHFKQDQRWIFSLNDDLEKLDTKTDAYALAFVLLSFSHYFKATGDERALKEIKATHDFLQSNMRSEFGGFEECYPVDHSLVRRQNPHMHLLEGYLAAYKVTQELAYKAQIDKLLTLAHSVFFDPKTDTLREFFLEDWKVHLSEGHVIEPGHHFEWIWLLHEANKVCPSPANIEVANKLWSIAAKHGLSEKSGVFNQIHADSYATLDAGKRIWPITEYLKALCVIDLNRSEKLDRFEKALLFLKDHYLTTDGRWNEYLNENDLPKDFPLPGTTTYHIFLGLSEVINWSQTEFTK
ncbi:AGE family epimerase/isomerase [Marinomonas mediterranea]|uniref:AGE family epimerase/isomerase n=1 Tax=Marinomonas mediterranea TaxID=119864 RepID=UPI00234A8DA0|nr:AGE family epimerase/isomerase [Marinomonas mediterranea]WCN10440.1 phosphoheptose isomerase [Marinomonas mediterranea]